MRTMIFSILAISLASLQASAYDGPPWYRVEASAKQKAFAKQKASYNLMDPSAAQFRNMFAISRGMGDDTVCGEMNAKNAYGAYTGFKPFYVDEDGKFQSYSPDDPIGMTVPMVCNKPRKK